MTSRRKRSKGGTGGMKLSWKQRTEGQFLAAREYFTLLCSSLPYAVVVLFVCHSLLGSPRMDSISTPTYSVGEVKEPPKFANELKEYIINGEVAKKGRFSYPVLLTRRGRGKCGGSLIAPDMVLTAAHCVTSRYGGPCDVSDHMVTIGTRNIVYHEEGAEEIAVAGCTVHPGWDRSRLVNDYAILQLDRDSKYTPVWLNSGAVAVSDGDDMTVMGWGLTSEKSGSLSPQLMELDLKYLELPKCRMHFKGLIELENCHLCIAPDGPQHKATFSGDSGGPVVVRSQGTPGAQDIQVGIVSFGFTSLLGRPGCPSVVARVSDAYEWIKENAPEARFASVSEKSVSGSPWFDLRLLFEALLLVVGTAFGYFIDHRK